MLSNPSQYSPQSLLPPFFGQQAGLPQMSAGLFGQPGAYNGHAQYANGQSGIESVHCYTRSPLYSDSWRSTSPFKALSPNRLVLRFTSSHTSWRCRACRAFRAAALAPDRASPGRVSRTSVARNLTGSSGWALGPTAASIRRRRDGANRPRHGARKARDGARKASHGAPIGRRRFSSNDQSIATVESQVGRITQCPSVGPGKRASTFGAGARRGAATHTRHTRLTQPDWRNVRWHKRKRTGPARWPGRRARPQTSRCGEPQECKASLPRRPRGKQATAVMVEPVMTD